MPMIILDENLAEDQCQLLRKWRLRFSQIGQFATSPRSNSLAKSLTLHPSHSARFVALQHTGTPGNETNRPKHCPVRVYNFLLTFRCPSLRQAATPATNRPVTN